MKLSDLEHLENVDSASVTGGLKIGVAFFALVEQSATAYSGAFSKDGDATATAVAKNNSTVNIGGFSF